MRSGFWIDFEGRTENICQWIGCRLERKGRRRVMLTRDFGLSERKGGEAHRQVWLRSLNLRYQVEMSLFPLCKGEKQAETKMLFIFFPI